METLSQVMHVFEKSHGIVPTTPLMYDLLFNSAYVLIANPGYTMTDIRLLLTSKVCRERLLQKVAHPDVRGFWESWDDPKLTPPQEQEKERKSILNKLNDFSHAPLRYIVGQSHSTINLQEIMDSGKILLVKLERKREQATSLIGSILVALILNASEARKTHKLFNLYADEFQNFATEDFAVLLEQARKKDIGVTIAHQNRGQLELSEKQADANLKKRTLSVGNLIVFRVPTDANELAGQFPQEPEKAWEEELEAERLEVREPERIETMEVIDGEETVKAITQRPFDELLTTHSSDNMRYIARSIMVPVSWTGG
jgi:hypothetical protein